MTIAIFAQLVKAGCLGIDADFTNFDHTHVVASMQHGTNRWRSTGGPPVGDTVEIPQQT
jgi:hypothetical protein